MNKVQQQVTEFHKAGGHVINIRPTVVDQKTIELRKRLIREEVLDELFPAMDRGDLVEIADALADVLYVVYGTAVSFGIDMEPISDEVHRSNMTKFSTVGAYVKTCDETGKSLKDEGGKTLKPPCYEPPQLAAILASQHPIDLENKSSCDCELHRMSKAERTELFDRVIDDVNAEIAANNGLLPDESCHFGDCEQEII